MAGKPKVQLGTVICWLRNDLRYHDNEVLYWACERFQNILPLYCFDPRHYQTTHTYKFPKTGPFRARFLIDSVEDVKHTLQQHGSDLLIVHGKPEDMIKKIATVMKVDAVVYQSEVTKEETDVEAQVDALAKQLNFTTHTLWGSTLYHKDDLRYNIKSLPDTYTEFRKGVEGQLKIRIEQPMPEKLKPLPLWEPLKEMQFSPTLEGLGIEVKNMDPRGACPFTGGETSALKRLKHYLWDQNLVESYKLTRNGLLGSDYSTKFSPWLAFGCLSPRRIYFEIKKYEKERVKNDSTYWVLFELIWRDYFRYVCAKYGTLVFYPGGIMQKKVRWSKDMIKFQKWADGVTGVPFVDANMREMLLTGWMSNRGRQNVASFLTKDLKMDWRLGAEWFEYLLVDYDVCSNYGNWNYSAGIGNDPREDRKFNMIKQATDYDPKGEFTKTWVPELASLPDSKVHIPWTLSKAELGCVKMGETYPLPMITAPEWTRHFDKTKNTQWTAHRQQNQKGIDFYFKNNSGKR